MDFLPNPIPHGWITPRKARPELTIITSSRVLTWVRPKLPPLSSLLRPGMAGNLPRRSPATLVQALGHSVTASRDKSALVPRRFMLKFPFMPITEPPAPYFLITPTQLTFQEVFLSRLLAILSPQTRELLPGQRVKI